MALIAPALLIGEHSEGSSSELLVGQKQHFPLAEWC